MASLLAAAGQGLSCPVGSGSLPGLRVGLERGCPDPGLGLHSADRYRCRRAENPALGPRSVLAPRAPSLDLVAEGLEPWLKSHTPSLPPRPLVGSLAFCRLRLKTISRRQDPHMLTSSACGSWNISCLCHQCNLLRMGGACVSACSRPRKLFIFYFLLNSVVFDQSQMCKPSIAQRG